MNATAETFPMACRFPGCDIVYQSKLDPNKWAINGGGCPDCCRRMRTHILHAFCEHSNPIPHPVCKRGTSRLPDDHVAPCGCGLKDFDFATTVWDWVLPTKWDQIASAD